MSARPGTAFWLLGHELRLFWRTALASGASGAHGGKERRRWRTLGGGLAVWLALHAGVFLLLRATGAATDAPPHQFVIAVSAILLATFLFMLSSALKASVEVLFDRGDMDLLLSSPLASTSIFSVKLAGIAIGITALYLFFLAPFAHVGLLLGQLRWLAVYPVLLAMAALAASMAMLLTLALVRWLGARRTRVVAQVIGAVAGALLFLLSQAGNFMAHDDGATAPSALMRMMSAGDTIDADSLLWLPARAALGEPVEVALVAMAGLLAAWATVGLTHRFFVHGLQQAADGNRATKRLEPIRYRFERSLFATIVVKEWRLIWRDPHLISQVLLQLLYLLPLCFLIFNKNAPHVAVTGAGLTMLCGSLSSALAWIVLLAEDAPDLLRTSPANAATVRLAKLAAAVAPVLVLAAAPIAWLTLQAPLAGACAAMTVGGAAASSSLITLWTGRSTTRSEFKSRGKRNIATSLLDVCSLLGWAALAWLLLRAPGAVQGELAVLGMGAACGGVLAVLLLAWLLRDRSR
jgi:ABC-2 type transport system permease protein